MDLSSRKRDILKEQWLSIAWRGPEVGGGGGDEGGGHKDFRRNGRGSVVAN